ncbi:hypothetical protein BDK51DRAFT_37586 [Blyttiomyces helicus]|uniref:MULE transposase domain-containing protein n=1 Tax=Blyttiomyces helicus TaxID=388810 RepID=A0A4P9VWY5_9FUNG|nr:hypothetical protein BDK51DRAFT_37586 [Blyttiomyces helicus]|eukprot:RKO84214.1 hypothetical protein BDK51DRAFT_37586 [Blyttiomyces helicus]
MKVFQKPLDKEDSSARLWIMTPARQRGVRVGQSGFNEDSLKEALETPRWRTSGSYKQGDMCHHFSQCQSGTDPPAATQKPLGKAQSRFTHAFSDCLAHVHVTFEVLLKEKRQEDIDTCGPILAIQGVLEHSEVCNELLSRGAPTHLHPTMAEMAKQETLVGSPASRILGNNAQYLMPKACESDCFELGIASSAMLAAAWQYGHSKVILMDGTFSVCLQKILFFVMLAIDESNHGVPMALFLFSAPLGNPQASSVYDAKILKRFLSKWRAVLGEKDGASFMPEDGTMLVGERAVDVVMEAAPPGEGVGGRGREHVGTREDGGPPRL